ncbi:MAG: UbiA family prenyltransferase [Flavobacteriales bacterium]
MLSILKSFRPINLGMMIFFMLFYRWFYLLEHVDTLQSPLLFSNRDYMLFTFAIVIGAGSGFMINDFYDKDIDKINHSKNKLYSFSPKTIWTIYFTLNAICGLITLYLVWENNIWKYIFIYPTSTFLLWIYSKALKRTFFFGNLTISVLISGVVIFILPFIELEHLNLIDSRHFVHLLFLTVLSFLLNLSREILKDVEDRKGDAKGGCKTLPIVLGINRTKQIIVFLFGLTSFVFLFFLTQFSHSYIFIISIYFLFLLYTTTLICFVKFAKQNKHFKIAAQGLKLLMFLGITLVILWI